MKTKYLRMANEQLSALLLRLLQASVLLLAASSAQAGVVFTNLYSFTGTNDGANPYAGLVQGSDGYFYGTTYSGGTNNLGTVFKISTNGAYTSLYSFTGTKDGANPSAGLVQGSDGNFYGTTYNGGTNNYPFLFHTNNYGTVFKISTNGALTSLYSFGSIHNAYDVLDGYNPSAPLVQGSDGYFYGTTYSGGIGAGTVFKISTNGALTTYSLTGIFDGSNPAAGLVQGSDGYFYGTTESGGQTSPNYNGAGAVFQISTNGAKYTTGWYEFPLVDSETQAGANPQATLVQGSDGYFYGTTYRGGYGSIQGSGPGTVFKISTNWVLTSLYTFGGSRGALPAAGLVQGSDGYFYGTTYYGGGKGYGTVFRMSTNGALTTLYSFSGTNDGANPRAVLVQGSDGSFYGTTSAGGTNNLGTVFRMTLLPGPPQLAITVSGANVILTWPTFPAGFALEFTTNLVSPVVWITNYSRSQTIIGDQNVVTDPISVTQMFFRLKQ